MTRGDQTRKVTLVGWELMTTRDVADVFNVNTSTVCRWRQDGVGPPFVKIGKTYRYPRGRLEQWMTAQLRQDAS